MPYQSRVLRVNCKLNEEACLWASPCYQILIENNNEATRGGIIAIVLGDERSSANDGHAALE